MDEQASKKNETPDHRPMRLVSRLVFFFVSSGVSSLSMEPEEIDTGFSNCPVV